MDPRESVDSRLSVNAEGDCLLAQSQENSDDSLAFSNREGTLYGTLDDQRRSSTIITMREYDQFTVHTICPHCQQETDTVLRHHTGSATFKCCALVTLLTCGLCLWLPFLLNDFKDVEHVCQHCGKTVATYKRKFISR